MDNPNVVEPLNHVSNAVKNIHQQLGTQLQKMQEIIQTIQMQYVAGPQNTHQDYGGHGYHAGHEKYFSQGGSGEQRRGN